MADPHQVSIVPSFESSRAHAALAEVENLKAELAPLEREARHLKVESPEGFEVAGTLLKRVRDNRKQGEEIVKPLKRVLQTIRDWLQTESLKHSSQCEKVETVLEAKMNDYRARERAAAAAEERRVNEERRKEAERRAEEQRKRDLAAAEEARKNREKEIADAQKAGELKKRAAEKLRKESEELEERQKQQAREDAERAKANVQEVKVEPLTPKVAGLRQRQNWRFKVVDIDKIPRPFLYPNVGPDGTYWPEDFPQIGQFVRNAKNKELSERTIPGIIVEAVDAI